MQEETYQLVMYMVYQAYREEIISKELFQEIDQYMCEKYNPIFPVSEKLWRSIYVMKDKSVHLIPPSAKSVNEANNHSEKRKVAAYARVSTEHEEQHSSYEAQIDYYSNLIKNNPNWEFAGVYSDEGITATSTSKRDGFNKMVQDAMEVQMSI